MPHSHRPADLLSSSWSTPLLVGVSAGPSVPRSSPRFTVLGSIQLLPSCCNNLSCYRYVGFPIVAIVQAGCVLDAMGVIVSINHTTKNPSSCQCCKHSYTHFHCVATHTKCSGNAECLLHHFHLRKHHANGDRRCLSQDSHDRHVWHWNACLTGLAAACGCSLQARCLRAWTSEERYSPGPSVLIDCLLQ